MKLVISTNNSSVSPHFGRCPQFTIVEIKEGKLLKNELIENPGHEPGFLPQFFKEMGVECIIAGGIGPRAQGLFNQYGIETISGVTGEVEDVISKILDGTLEGGKSLCDRVSDAHKEN